MRQVRDNWDNSWKKYDFNSKLDLSIIRQESLSVRWRKIKKAVLSRYGAFKGLKVVEIGSGRGEISLLFALEGADVSLVDYSREALVKARELFGIFGLEPKCINADVFNIPGSILGSFDVSMSFGLAEHFDQPLRRQIFRVHADLLAPEGLLFVAVPNKACFPYRFFMRLCDMLGYRSQTIEIPFSRGELEGAAVDLGLNKAMVFGSSFIRDTAYFVCTRYISHLTGWKTIIDTSLLEIPTFLDDHLGYSLVLSGVKK